MKSMSDYRPSPDDLLKQVTESGARSKRGRLKIFFGMCPGVGKTYAMLKDAIEQKKAGVKLSVGIVETHKRAETEFLLQGFEVMKRKRLEHAGAALEEFDLDLALQMKPELILVDELAHTNAPGSRHPKRYQDIEELLHAGIHVYTTMNVQHVESRVDLVHQITGVAVREKVPDSFLAKADEIEIVDISPEQLLKRLHDGKVYLEDRIERAAQNFFKIEALSALRELALRFTAEVVDDRLRGQMTLNGIQGPWNTNERLLVAVSQSPFSGRLIRAARRMAYNLEAPWVALYIDTGATLSADDEMNLKKNLDSARELGAEVIARRDHSVPSAMMQVAREKNVTQIIMGRPDRRMIQDFISGGNILDLLVNETSEIDIHIIRQKRPPQQIGFHLKWPEFSSPFNHYLKTLLYIAIISAFNYAALPYVGYRALGFVFLLSFLPVALFAGLGTTLFAASLSALIWDYCFIPPQFTFVIREFQDLMMILVYFAVALVSGVLARRLKKQELALIDREYRAGILYEFERKLANVSTAQNISSHASDSIHQIFKFNSAVFLRTPAGTLSDKSVNGFDLPFSLKDQALAHWSFENKKKAGRGTDTLPDANCLCYPLHGRSRPVGVLLVYPTRLLPLNEENLLETIATNLAGALEREHLEADSRRAQILEQSEKMHQTLLNSVSHELRTPLTSIMGIASAFSDSASFEDKNYRESLALNLSESSERLKQTIDNILDMTRISSGVLQIENHFFELNDFIRSWLSRSKNHYLEHRLKWRDEGSEVFIRGDEKLLDSVLTNLVSNATKYSPPGTAVEITVTEHSGSVEIQVFDEGSGIAPESIDHVFDRFYRGNAQSKGLGLGLSIVKAIVEAHLGTVSVQNRVGHVGAVFTVSLPAHALPEEAGLT